MIYQQSKMGDIDRASLRANILERKKLDQLVSIYESSKRNLITDIRKTQATYRRKLKAYRERKREIMVAKAKNSHTYMDDLLLDQLKARATISTKSGVKSSSSSQDTVETLSRQITIVSESSDIEGGKIFKSKLSAYTSEISSVIPVGMQAVDPGNKNQQMEKRTIVNVKDVCQTSDRAGPRVNRKYLLTAKALPVRSPSPISTFPSPVSAVSPDILSQTLSSRLKPGTATVDKVIPELEMRRAQTSFFPSIQGRQPFEVGPGHSEPEFEMPRSSSRQRSRLDLRPRTAWELLNEQIASDDRRPPGSRKTLQNTIAGSNCQIVYMDKDELQERGTFYNYLLRGRLEREHFRFANICHKVQDFCRSPSLFLVVGEATTTPSVSSDQRPRSSKRYSVFPRSETISSGSPTIKQKN